MFKTPLFLRLLAGVLAVVLLGELFLYQLSSIRFTWESYQATRFAELARYLDINDEYMNRSRLNRMADVLDSLIAPSTFDDFSILASRAIAQEDYAAAVEYLEKALDLFEGSEEELAALCLRLGCLYGFLDDWATAQGQFQRSVELVEENPDGWLLLAEAALQGDDFETAAHALDIYRTYAPLSASQLATLASMKVSLGDGDAAVSLCTEALALPDAEPSELLYTRAQGWLLLGDLEQAKADVEACLALPQSAVDARVLKALCTTADGEYAEALELYMEIIQEGNRDAALLEQAAQCSYLAEDFPRMQEISQAALDADPVGNLPFTQWLGIAQLQQEAFQEAESSFTTFLNRYPQMAQVNYLRGLARISQEDFEGAAADFTAAIQADTMVDECLYNRAICSLQLEDTDSAAADLQEILTRGENEEVVLMTLALLGVEL